LGAKSAKITKLSGFSDSFEEVGATAWQRGLASAGMLCALAILSRQLPANAAHVIAPEGGLGETA